MSARRQIIDSRRRCRRERGSVLIVALLVAAIIALGLGSYLNLNLSSTRLSKRTFNGYAALNLAEAGTEEGVWSFNRVTQNDPGAWTGWTNNGVSAWQKFSGFDFGANTTGWVKVYVDNFKPGPSARPKIIAQATIGGGTDAAVSKMLEVTLRRRSYFANGVVAKESVVFSGGNASVDAWNSDPDNNPGTAPIPFDPSIRVDRGSVVTTSVVNTAVLVNNANIWGYVATGGGAPQVGTNGTILGADSPTGIAIDPKRVSTDFNADFPLITAPIDGTPLLTLGPTLGTPGEATKWRVLGIVLSGNETLTILGHVTLILTAASGTDAISVTGNASILIPDGSSLTVYTEGNVKIAGRGVGNDNVQPISFQLWGTNTSNAGHAIDVAGNGALKAVVYAPHADVKVNGNGDVMGSLVARNITFVGNAAFHYDEALGYKESNEPFGIAKWRELSTAAEKAPYQALFENW